MNGSIGRMRIVRWLLFCFRVFVSVGNIKSEVSTQMAGDILIGGLFSIHTRTTTKLPCGHVLNEQVGIHRLEAMLYAVDKVRVDIDFSFREIDSFPVISSVSLYSFRAAFCDK